MVLDHEGCGQSDVSAEALESQLDAQLRRVWGAQGKAIVIRSEVDAWVWGSDNALRTAFVAARWPVEIGFEGEASKSGRMASHCNPKKHWTPCGPYERPRSSALYEKITSRVSRDTRMDGALRRLRAQSGEWFAAGER